MARYGMPRCAACAASPRCTRSKCVTLAPWFFELGKLQWSQVDSAALSSAAKPVNTTSRTTWRCVKPETILRRRGALMVLQGLGEGADPDLRSPAFVFEKCRAHCKPLPAAISCGFRHRLPCGSGAQWVNATRRNEPSAAPDPRPL